MVNSWKLLQEVLLLQNERNNGLKIRKESLKGIGRNVLSEVSNPMATDAEQPSGDVAQKVAGFARSPGIASPTAGDVPGQLDHSKECLAFLRPL